MAMKTIPPYRMPDAADVPPATLPWRPRPDRAAVLVHDMQRYFLRPFTRGRSPFNELMTNTRILLTAARRAEVPVMYTAQPGGMTREERGLLYDLWGPGMSVAETDRGIAAEIAPQPGETVLTKWRYSAFYRSDLEERLRRSGRDQLIICGVYAHVGCLMTVCEAFTRDIQPFLVADALADFSLEDHVMALRYAARRCAVPLSTAETTMWLQTQPATSSAPSSASEAE
ncbi:isochorismatase family protein [Verrucosispora sp. WMMA2044]|uniref:isochorismatase family protein n=1 Tax=Verrucosispora sp. WMMA2044 TaxID=3016419 RepID=UPI00248AE122|nr:isochorismatase family protein [Verrucosispora sp. WMMA2044]WBB50421.1 isochorismatase family protein [Verrucosispora sp. WMMA2044]